MSLIRILVLFVRGVVRDPTELAAENFSTWAHELVHAADLKCGTLSTKSPKRQELSNEVVAEVGGATLLLLIGRPSDADLGGCFEYVKRYCDREEKNIGRTCLQLLERIGRAVSLILDTADELAPQAVGGKAVA